MLSALREMPTVDEGDVFFDTENSFMSMESVVVKEDSCFRNFEYDIWLREPQSVKERREAFSCRVRQLECLSYKDFEAEEMEIVSNSSGLGSSSANFDDNLLLCERQHSNGEANCSVDYSELDWWDGMCIEGDEELDEKIVKVLDGNEEIQNMDQENKRSLMRWWRHCKEKMKKPRNSAPSEPTLLSNAGQMSRIWTRQHKKRFLECSALYTRQEIKAHNGLIWTVKFSPDGQFLASGGEDAVIYVWSVNTTYASCKTTNHNFGRQDFAGKSGHKRVAASRAYAVIPEKIFHIEEIPLHKLTGHRSDVLDLSWSTSNHLLSASMDKTVRLWQVGSNECLAIFHHCNYVTCVQFNPKDENSFISGSIDGKVRIWGVEKKRVEDWTNVKDVITAICYRPNGKGFVVGSVSGTCHFFETSGSELQLSAFINIRRKSIPGNKITVIEFLKNDSQRVMITSEDSTIRILDGIRVVCKYRGSKKSGCQKSASFASNGRHIISVGDDSNVYTWNYDHPHIQTSKQAKTIRSCERFYLEGVSMAIPWSDSYTRTNLSSYTSSSDPEQFSLANWFSMDGAASKCSATWPEEKLPSWDLSSLETDSQPCKNFGVHFHEQARCKISRDAAMIDSTWGLVFVTAGWEGTIRTFQNFGFPVRA